MQESSKAGKGSKCNPKIEGETIMAMQGKICLITGGTNGIGKSTAQELARMGATVVIVGRDAQKTFKVVEEMRTASGNKNVDSLLADLSSQQDIRRLAAEFRANMHIFMSCSTTPAEHSRHAS
jgi:NAD(P)-dependent dehydrogenase (short-subunit alcohol dehydrogenase family)